MLSAKWIWKQQETYNIYNQALIFRKILSLGQIRHAIAKVSADSFYRLVINGVWVNDGPCRSWPEHYCFDEVEITSYLRSGENEVRVIARYWGAGTFHSRPQQAGLIAQIEIELTTGETITVCSDKTWEVCEAQAWKRNTPKISIQMEPQEFYNARLEDDLKFEPAVELYEAESGPWKDLQPSNLALLSKKPFAFKGFLQANLICRSPDLNFCIPAARLANPGLVETNRNVTQPGGICTIIEAREDTVLRLYQGGMQVYIDGHPVTEQGHHLTIGKHIITVFITEVVGHNKEKELRFLSPPTSMHLTNPIDPAHTNPWCWIAFPEYNYVKDDLRWPEHPNEPQFQAFLDAYQEMVSGLGRSVVDLGTFHNLLAGRAQCMPFEGMFVEDTHWRFGNRESLGSAITLVDNPSGLIYDNGEMTVVHPSPDGDIEMVYDLGEQNIGYYDFELISDAGVEIDIFGVEYITPEGVIQHTWGNRNGMRYITKAGTNRFTSTKRRSGRYLFITLRNQTSPVRFRNIQLIESTYPVNAVGSFQCSDARLERIWEISARSLKLCMEDSFTDCPLFEQTHWVGDARNESLFAYQVFGAEDLIRRCITLSAQSLERYPLAGCQVPSGWDCILPAWSFLWGISVWDYYFCTGDKTFLKEIWPWVIRNIKGASDLLDENGLFSALFWNMFDWTGIDDRHATVLHNSMLLVGAIDAALSSSEVLGDEGQSAWLSSFREKLCASINHFWDTEKRAYPDSIHADGSLSHSTSQHTSFLSILYNIIDEQNLPAALENLLHPPEVMVRVGSPFAMLYYYEALDKVGNLDIIIQSIYDTYLPMLTAGATTVWETFPESVYRPGIFPTRSHCHGWSAAPLHYLNRILLGIRQTEPGGKDFEISPRLNGLEWAYGINNTPSGPLSVRWHVDAERLDIKINAPKDVNVLFIENETHKSLQVAVEITYLP